jgi:hypothetical protein
MARRSKKSSTKFIAQAIKRPGALTKAKKKGESTGAAASRLAKHGTPLQKRQANFYLNVLAPANRRRKGTGASAGGGRKRGATHMVKAHTRHVGGKRVRVKGHRRKNG